MLYIAETPISDNILLDQYEYLPIYCPSNINIEFLLIAISILNLYEHFIDCAKYCSSNININIENQIYLYPCEDLPALALDQDPFARPDTKFQPEAGPMYKDIKSVSEMATPLVSRLDPKTLELQRELQSVNQSDIATFEKSIGSLVVIQDQPEEDDTGESRLKT